MVTILSFTIHHFCIVNGRTERSTHIVNGKKGGKYHETKNLSSIRWLAILNTISCVEVFGWKYGKVGQQRDTCIHGSD